MTFFSKTADLSTHSLWSEDPATRLAAARSLDDEAIAYISRKLSDGCPVKPWPYGNATVANPLILTVGVSPGGSPAKGDKSTPSHGGHEGPTFGKPNDGIYYEDVAKFWIKLRILAESCLPQFSEPKDAHSLYGHLNLDTGCAGNAKNASFNSELAGWILSRIRDHFRPRYVILLGLQGYFKKYPEAADALTNTLFNYGEQDGSITLTNPHRKFLFSKYKKKNLYFKEWDVVSPDGRTTTYTMWPQHPSRPPFSDIALWKGACSQFARRLSRRSVTT